MVGVRLTALCDDVPDASAGTANGSTLVSASVLARLPPDIEIDLVCFDDGRRRLDPELAQRCRSVTRLPLRSARGAAAAAVVSPLPRATWLRSGRAALRRAERVAAEADVLYVHGLHAFGLAVRLQRGTRRPAVFNELDDWHEHFRQRVGRESGLRRLYAARQATTTRNLQVAASRFADSYVAVASADAERLAGRLGRHVVAVPNGVTVTAASAASAGEGPDARRWDGEPTLGFLGSLSYGPNVEAVRELVEEVLPRVRRTVGAARVVVAGRNAGEAVRRLAGPAVEVVGEVPDAGAFYRSVAVMVYPGETGTGAKNTVVEAMAAGAAVVATPVAARGVDARGQLVLAQGPAALADAVSALLENPSARRRLCDAAERWGRGRPTWDASAAAYEQLLRSAVRASAAGRPARRP